MQRVKNRIKSNPLNRFRSRRSNMKSSWLNKSWHSKLEKKQGWMSLISQNKTREKPWDQKNILIKTKLLSLILENLFKKINHPRQKNFKKSPKWLKIWSQVKLSPQLLQQRRPKNQDQVFTDRIWKDNLSLLNSVCLKCLNLRKIFMEKKNVTQTANHVINLRTKSE